MTEPAIITCAVTGVLTDPSRHPVPVTQDEMAQACWEAREAGAAVVHVHFRRQEPGMGHLPTWEPAVCRSMVEAIRARCPDLVINMSTGVVGPDVSGPCQAMEAVRPEMAALNAGSLNYLKTKSDGTWAWPPLLFDNPVEKIETMLATMERWGVRPELECFDTGMVRSLGMFQERGMVERPHVNLVMGVPSGQPADPDLLPILRRHLPRDATWEVTAIGRAEVWALHQRAAEAGAALRTVLEDTFYLPDGRRAPSNGPLVEAMVGCARRAGREVATPREARVRLGLRPGP